MSPIGKFFVVANLILAAIFVGAAASLIGTSDHWRSQYETTKSDLEAQLSTKDGEITALNNQVSGLTGERDRQLSQISQLEGEREALQGRLTTAERKNSELEERLTSIDGRLGDLSSTNQSLNNRIQDLEREARNLVDARNSAQDERDQAVLDRNAAQEAQQVAQNEANDLTRTLANVRTDLEDKDAMLATVQRLYNVDLGSLGGAQPHQEGTVLDVSYDEGVTVVMISLGSRDNVRRGYSYDVYNGRDYKGRIMVETVNEATAGATVTLPGKSQIERGDRIQTQL